MLQAAVDLLQVLNLCDNSKEETFQINVDVQHFNPKDVTVKISQARLLIIECKHQEKKNQQGSISRHFIKTIYLPEKFDSNKLTAKLSSDGLLMIRAPQAKNKLTARQISVIQTGKPAKEVDNNKLKHKL